MNQLWKAAGAAAWGAAALGGLQPFLGPEAAEQLHTLCPGAQTVLVGAFPYYAGQAPGNLSLYCRGEDYHLVLGRRLEQVCAGLLPYAQELHFRVVGDPARDPDATLALRQAAVLLVEACGQSDFHRIVETMNALALCQARVVGLICL